MNVLGGSPLPQPNNLFTLPEYREFLRQYDRLWQPKQKDFAAIDAAELFYRARLPVYLLARCPFCSGYVYEAVDTYSLNGLGWELGAGKGLGWYGQYSPASENTIQNQRSVPRERVSYEATCSHVRIVSWGVNLNGKRPNDVSKRIDIVSERPFLMTIPLQAEDVRVVIHALPVGRFDDVHPTPHSTAYFMTYFTNNDDAFRHATAVWRDPEDPLLGLMSAPFVYDLLPWVHAQRLLWLDPSDPQLPLRGDPTEAFPYANIPGRTHGHIQHGRLMSGGVITSIAWWFVNAPFEWLWRRY